MNTWLLVMPLGMRTITVLSDLGQKNSVQGLVKV